MDNTDKQIWGETISKDKEQPAYKFTAFVSTAKSSIQLDIFQWTKTDVIIQW